MATSVVGIYNQALSIVGSSSVVADPNEPSREAETCTLWYQDVVDKVLEAAPWSSARAVFRLALKKKRDFTVDWVASDPEPPWTYAYAYPSDMIRPRFLTDFARFALGQTDGARTVLSDAVTPMLVYTMRQNIVPAWEPGLRMAIIHALAAHICMPLSGGLKKAELALNQANQQILDARLVQANTDFDRLESVAEWHQARGFGLSNQPKYFYPDGALFDLGSLPRGNV